MNDPARSTPMPAVIIGGFLGAGKTTLLNRVLAADHGLRIGVIVNDFGSLTFDEELADAASSHRRLLANGCVCCSIQNDLIATITELALQDPPLDAVVIEASGIADPASLIAALKTTGLQRPVRVRSVVTVADAGRLREQEQDYGGELVLKQLRAASLIVLNKRDLVDPDVLGETRAWLTTVGAHGAALDAVHCDVPLEMVLGGSGADAPALHGSPDRQQPQFAEWTLQTDARFDADRVRRIFERVPAGIVRVKGVVELPEGSGRLLLQFAGGRLDLSPAQPAGAGQSGTRIVAIGQPQAIDQAALERLFLQTP